MVHPSEVFCFSSGHFWYVSIEASSNSLRLEVVG